MPKRLLEVERIYPTDDKFCVRLQNCSSSSKKNYVALSYCWGGPQANKTTLATLESNTKSIQWEEIPASIQDAVRVTVGLGFKWLWVDSLCIVQDDQEEMAQQIALMPKIYSEASLTIIASKAAKATDGFLGNMDFPGSGEDIAFKIPCVGRSDSLSERPARGAVYAFDANQDSIWWKRWKAMDLEPLEKRGWTFQEHWLSSRILEFRTSQVRLTCFNSLSYDISGYPKYFRDGWDWRARRMDWDVQTTRDNGELYKTSSEAKGTRMYQWTGECARIDSTGYERSAQFYRMVEAYTERELSNSQDRILAISGVAEVFRQALSDEYLAGIWKESLPLGLLWRVGSEWGLREAVVSGKPQSRPAQYQAPSWSWAAINSQVSFWDASQVQMGSRHLSEWDWILAKVEARITLVENSAPCGAVHRNSRLTGVGKITTAWWDGDSDLYEPQAGHPTVHSRLNSSPMVRIQGARVYPDAIEKEFETRGLENDDATRGEARNLIPVHLLEIAYRRSRTTDPDFVIHGLVLRAEEDSSPGGDDSTARHCSGTVSRYSRLGIFRYYKLHPDDTDAESQDVYDKDRLAAERFLITFRKEAFEMV